VSKCIIHHALVEAEELHHLASLGVAETIFTITCGGTLLLHQAHRARVPRKAKIQYDAE